MIFPLMVNINVYFTSAIFCITYPVPFNTWAFLSRWVESTLVLLFQGIVFKEAQFIGK